MTRAALHRHSLHVSASQIATYRDCPRKWAHQYVDGIKGPPNKYAELGINVHEILAAWFSRGTAPNLSTREGQIAFAGLKHFGELAPHIGTSKLHVEHEMRFEFDNVEYLGYLDLHHVLEPRAIVVIDHKTSTEPEKWAKTEGELLVDPQRILYSAWATLAYDVHHVHARWVYYSTRPPYRSRVVEVHQTREEIWRAMGSVHATAKEIVRARNRSSAEAEQNFNVCGAYGGCPFRERCHAGLSATDRMLSVFAQMERVEAAVRHEPVSVPLPWEHGKIVQKPQPQSEQGTTKMSLLKMLQDKDTNAAPEKRPGMDPGRARAAYDAAPVVPAPAPTAAPALAPAPAAAPALEPDRPMLAAVTMDEPTPLPSDVEDEIAEGHGFEADIKTGEAPTPTRKKGSGKASGMLAFSIADEKTGKLVLHAVGLLAGRSAQEVQEHTKAIYG